MPDSWYPVHALHLMGLKGLPRSQKGIRERAQRDGWPSREAPGKGGPGGTRVEYRPPADVQLQINEIEARRNGHLAEEEGAKYSLQDDFVMVPRYNIAGSAGGGALIQSEQIVDHLAFRADWLRNALGVAHADLALISVKGDSMEPTLSSGDLILIDTSVRALGDSAVYVLRKGDELFVKRIQHKLDGTVIVKSDNERYEPEILDSEHAPAVQVVGRVLWVGRRL